MKNLNKLFLKGLLSFATFTLFTIVSYSMESSSIKYPDIKVYRLIMKFNKLKESNNSLKGYSLHFIDEDDNIDKDKLYAKNISNSRYIFILDSPKRIYIYKDTVREFLLTDLIELLQQNCAFVGTRDPERNNKESFWKDTLSTLFNNKSAGKCTNPYFDWEWVNF